MGGDEGEALSFLQGGGDRDSLSTVHRKKAREVRQFRGQVPALKLLGCLRGRRDNGRAGRIFVTRTGGYPRRAWLTGRGVMVVPALRPTATATGLARSLALTAT